MYSKGAPDFTACQMQNMTHFKGHKSVPTNHSVSYHTDVKQVFLSRITMAKTNVTQNLTLHCLKHAISELL